MLKGRKVIYRKLHCNGRLEEDGEKWRSCSYEKWRRQAREDISKEDEDKEDEDKEVGFGSSCNTTLVFE